MNDASKHADHSVSDHWAQGHDGQDDIFERIMAAVEATGLDPMTLTVEQLSAADHLHARGFRATVELADELPIEAGHHIVDIGCGIGGPARYIAERFGCTVSGIDITGPFVEAAEKLTALLGMAGHISVEVGDACALPFDDAIFDGGYSQHVAMNIADCAPFFTSAFRVLKPGAFFALTEHGLGHGGALRYPLPWSEDGSGSHLIYPEETARQLEDAGFVEVAVTRTGEGYARGYRRMLDLASKGELPALGTHVVLGAAALDKIENAALNIEEGRTDPIQIVCLRPGERP